MLVSTLIAIIGFASSVRAWGDLGHKTAANVALRLISDSPQVVQRVKEILAADPHKKLDNPYPTIVDIASWADPFSGMKQGLFSAKYHYIKARDNPASDCNVDMRRDCQNNECIVGAIANYTRRLTSPESNDRSPQNKADYLKFLVHFVADVTQPLHTDSYEEGGTTYMIRWGNQQKALHRIWDSEMVDKIVDMYNGMDLWTTTIVHEIEHGVFRNPEWVACASSGDPLDCALEWARESNKLVCSHVLKFNPGDDLSQDYFKEVAPVIEEQIAKAGARLAALLVRIFGSGEAGEIPLATKRITVQRGDL